MLGFINNFELFLLALFYLIVAGFFILFLIIERDRLARSERKFEAILNCIGDGVFVLDKKKRIVLFNPMAEKISGYTKEEVRGKVYNKVLKFVFEKNHKENKEFIESALNFGRLSKMLDHTILIAKGGKEIPVDDSAAPLKDSLGKVVGCIVIFRDVTKQREIDRMKTDFVSVASHQLRTPASAIKWFLETLLTGEEGKLNRKQQDFLMEAYNANQRMISLINDLLNVSRLEAGKMKIVPVPCDLSDTAESALHEIKVIFAPKKHKYTVKIPKDLPKIYADPQIIRQILVNLLSNAAKYTNPGGRIALTITRKPKTIIWQVKDNGIGIPTHQQNRIFDRFFRADNVVQLETEGTGLGLFVVKNLAEMMGGKIWFTSKEGKGSTFYFSMPLHIANHRFKKHKNQKT